MGQTFDSYEEFKFGILITTEVLRDKWLLIFYSLFHGLEEKKMLREFDATTMWFTYMSCTIFSVPSDLLLKYQDECIQMHKVFISLNCHNAYQVAFFY